VDHAGLHDGIEVHARIAENFLLIQNACRRHLRFFVDSFRIDLDQVGAPGTISNRRISLVSGGVFLTKDDFGIHKHVLVRFDLWNRVRPAGHAKEALHEGIRSRGMTEVIRLILDNLARLENARRHQRRAVVSVMIRSREVIQS